MRSKIFNPATGEFDEIFNKKNYALENQQGMSIVIPRGEIGPRGLTGEKGEKGDPGESITGPIGPVGPVGPMGPRGPKGEKGDPGINGKDGVSIIGPSGLNGKDGIDGKTNLILYVSGTPKKEIGDNDDWCFTDLGEIFYKKNNKWEFYRQISSGYSKQSIIKMINDFGGNSRSINIISVDTNAENSPSVDYFYIVTNGSTITMPTAVLNTNLYTIKRSGSSSVTVTTINSETIDGSLSISLNLTNESRSLISDGSNWIVI